MDSTAQNGEFTGDEFTGDEDADVRQRFRKQLNQEVRDATREPASSQAEADAAVSMTLVSMRGSDNTHQPSASDQAHEIKKASPPTLSREIKKASPPTLSRQVKKASPP